MGIAAVILVVLPTLILYFGHHSDATYFTDNALSLLYPGGTLAATGLFFVDYRDSKRVEDRLGDISGITPAEHDGILYQLTEETLPNFPRTAPDEEDEAEINKWLDDTQRKNDGLEDLLKGL